MEIIDVPIKDLIQAEYNPNFQLADGEKDTFQQMTFTFADEQATKIRDAIEDIKKTDTYKYIETFGNENSNGNAIYCLIMEWVNG